MDESGFKGWLPLFYGEVSIIMQQDTRIRVMKLFGKVYEEEILQSNPPESLSFAIKEDASHPFSNHRGDISVVQTGVI